MHSILDTDGNNVLHYLIKTGKKDMAQHVLNAFNTRKRGASQRSLTTMKLLVSKPNVFGETPLSLAIEVRIGWIGIGFGCGNFEGIGSLERIS